MDKKNPRDLFQVLWSHMILLCEKKSRMYCIPVTAALKRPSPFTYLKKQCHIDNRPGVIKVFSKREEDHKYISTWNLNFSLFYGDLFPPALEY